jgi:hypothetical protein
MKMIFTHAHLCISERTEYNVTATGDSYVAIKAEGEKSNLNTSILVSIKADALDGFIQKLMLAKSELELKPEQMEVALWAKQSLYLFGARNAARNGKAGANGTRMSITAGAWMRSNRNFARIVKLSGSYLMTKRIIMRRLTGDTTTELKKGAGWNEPYGL